MRFRTKLIAWAIVMSLVLMIGFSTIRPVIPEQLGKAQFVIAEWDYPDEYGQGIDGLKFYENSTGGWVAAPYYTDAGTFFYLNYYETGYTLNWSAGVGFKLRVFSVLNVTLVGAGDIAEGKNYQRHNVTVTSAGITVFSQENFTYYDSAWTPPLVVYEYDVVLNFLPISGLIYTVIVTYEIYW